MQKLYTTKDLAEKMGISRVAVFNRIKKGQIKATKVGRNYVIQNDDLAPDFGQGELSAKGIEKAVKKVLSEYGETIKMLGAE